jgi:hypothetical protein
MFFLKLARANMVLILRVQHRDEVERVREGHAHRFAVPWM